MKRLWVSILCLFLSTDFTISGVIIINEVMYDPQYNDNYYEFVEIYNPLDSLIDLSGWKLSDGAGNDIIINAGQGTLLSGYGIIIDSDYFNHEPLYDYLIPDECLILTVDGSTLGDRGLSNTSAETIILLDFFGDTIDQYQYSIGNQPGHSDEKIDIYGNNSPSNWSESLYPDGTPGFNNSVSPHDYNITLTNFSYTPANPTEEDNIVLTVTVKNTGIQDISNVEAGLFVDADNNMAFTPVEMFLLLEYPYIANGDSTVSNFTINPVPTGYYLFGAVNLMNDDFPFDDTVSVQIKVGNILNAVIFNEIMYKPLSGGAEWLELYNRTAEDMNLSGWGLTEPDVWSMSNPFSGIIKAGDYIVIADDSTVFNHPGLTTDSNIEIVDNFPSLNNDGDIIYLLDLGGNIIDSLNYPSDWGNVDKGISMARVDPFSDSGLSNWLPSADPEGCSPCGQNSVYFPQNLHNGLKLNVEPEVFFTDGSGAADAIKIKIELPFPAGTANLRVFDVKGRLVRFLVKSQYIGNETEFEWDGKNDSGTLSRIGPYILHLEVISETFKQKAEAKTVVVLGKTL